jgi:hypothetical protein
MTKLYFLLVSFICMSNIGFSQEESFIISSQGKTIKVSPSFSKNEKSLHFNLKNTKEKCFLKIENKQFAAEKDWVRTYKIYTSTDSLVFELENKKSITKISVEEMKNKITPKNKYYLYTVSIPTDPEKAATIRVARMFLCAIEVN